MLTVIEAAAGEKDGEVARVMSIGIAQIAAKERHGVVEQGIRPFLFPTHPFEQVAETA